METLEEPTLIKPQATTMVYTKTEGFSKTVKGKNDEPDTFVTRTRDLVVAKDALLPHDHGRIFCNHRVTSPCDKRIPLVILAPDGFGELL